MILLRDLRLAPGEDMDALRRRAAKKLGLRPGGIRAAKLVRRSLDARKKDDIHYVCSLAVELGEQEEARLLARKENRELTAWQEKEYAIPQAACAERPVVVGFGPAGMFAALLLAYAGARPIVLERGGDVDSRLAAVERFRAGGAGRGKQRPVRRGRRRHLFRRQAEHRHARQPHRLGAAAVLRPRRSGGDPL